MTKRIISPYRGVIINLIAKQAMVAIITAAPPIAFPPFAFLINGVLKLIVGFILDYTILGMNLVYVIGETTYDLYKFKKSLAEYAEAKKLNKTEEEMDKIEKEIIKHGFDLVDLNGIRF